MEKAGTVATPVPETADALLVLERMDEGFYALDRNWRLVHVNGSAELFWGLKREQILGRSMLEVFSRFYGSPAYEAHRQAMESGAPGRVETISTATGSPVELRLFPSPAGLSVYFHDITKRRQMEQELKNREELLSLAENSAGIGVWISDLTAGTMVATPQYYRLLGLEPVDGPVPQELPRSLRHAEDRERVTRGFEEALATGADTYEVEYRIVRPSGEQRWIFGRGRIMRDADDRPWRYSGVDLDITERKKQDEHLHTVMKELLHRTNNLLAVVEGMARQTARSSGSLEDFVPVFQARLRGLGQSSALLARGHWRGAALDELIRAHLGNFADLARFELSGPNLLLSPRAVQNLGLAFHELGTNAIKYGALSVPAGKVLIEWRVHASPTGPRLHLRWKETGGPAVMAPTRQGFGRVVCEQMIAAALAATVATEFATDGVEWRVELPLEEFSSGDTSP